MRRSLTVLVAGCLVLAGSLPALAQPSPEPASFGGFVELPGRGVAIEFPADWLVFDLSGDIDARARSIEAAVGDVFPAGRDATVADLEGRRDRIALMALSRGEEACDLRILTARRVDLHDPEYMAAIDSAISAEPGISGYTGAAPLELPAGPALTWSWVQLAAGADGADMAHTAYMIDGGIRGVLLTCEGAERPDDDWASIAETVEFPAAPGPFDLVGIGGRVEVEPSGFAMTFPDDWVWARTSEGGTDALIERLAAMTDAGYAEEYRGLLAEVEGISPLVGWPLRGGEHCRVGEVSTTQQLDEIVARLLEVFEENKAMFPDGATVSSLEIDGREFVRLDYAQSEPGVEGQRAGSHYMTVANRTYYYVACIGAQAPADRWLSIGGTVELLTSEE